MTHSREIARCFSEEQFWGRGGEGGRHEKERRCGKRREKRCEYVEGGEQGGWTHTVSGKA